MQNRNNIKNLLALLHIHYLFWTKFLSPINIPMQYFYRKNLANKDQFSGDPTFTSIGITSTEETSPRAKKILENSHFWKY
jgi:hypothetical protein